MLAPIAGTYFKAPTWDWNGAKTHLLQFLVSFIEKKNIFITVTITKSCVWAGFRLHKRTSFLTRKITREVLSIAKSYQIKRKWAICFNDIFWFLQSLEFNCFGTAVNYNLKECISLFLVCEWKSAFFWNLLKYQCFFLIMF